MITANQFRHILNDLVQEYIDNFDRFDSNPQIRVLPVTMRVDIVNGADLLSGIADSDEAVEDAAAADGMGNEEATDFQVTMNPDYYPVKHLLQPKGNTDIPSAVEIDKIVEKYF